MSTTIPRRPKSLPEAAASLWKQTCHHLIEAGPGPTPAQLPLIESYCRSTLRLERMRSLEADLDLLDKEGRDALKLIHAEERQQLAHATALRLTPRAAAAQASGPKGGRSPGTGASALRANSKPTAASGEVHWLDKARSRS